METPGPHIRARGLGLQGWSLRIFISKKLLRCFFFCDIASHHPRDQNSSEVVSFQLCVAERVSNAVHGPPGSLCRVNSGNVVVFRYRVSFLLP